MGDCLIPVWRKEVFFDLMDNDWSFFHGEINALLEWIAFDFVDTILPGGLASWDEREFREWNT